MNIKLSSLLVYFLLLLTAAPCGFSQTEPENQDAIRIETRLVNLNVKVTDRAGQSIVDST